MKKCVFAGVLVLMFIFLQGCGSLETTQKEKLNNVSVSYNDKGFGNKKQKTSEECKISGKIGETEEIGETGSMCVHYTVNGTTKTAYTNAKTVAEFIKEIRLYFGEYDRISVDKDSLIYDGLEFTIQRVLVKTETETEVVAYDTITKETNDLGADETKVEIEGIDGEYQHTYEVVYVDGVEESRTLLDEGYVTKPITKVVLNGTGKTVDRVEYYGDTDAGGYRIVYYTDGSSKVIE